jgi:hypothetical protein
MLRPIDALSVAEPPAKSRISAPPSSATVSRAAALPSSRSVATTTASAPVKTQEATTTTTADAADTHSATNAAGVYYSGNLLVVTPPVSDATLQALVQIRDEMLAPPATPSDFEIAAQASIDIQRAQSELASGKYSSVAAATNPASIPPPPSTTDVKA